MEPKKINKFVNIVDFDPKAQINKFELKVFFENEQGKRHLYDFLMPEGAHHGTFIVKELPQKDLHKGIGQQQDQQQKLNPELNQQK